ncbi:MAG: hypothetical protein QM820_28415 [Minicystis sp.]
MSLGLSSVLALALGQAAAGCVFRSADDCQLTLGFGCTTTSSSGSGTGGSVGGAGGSGAGSTTSTATGTGGTTPECTSTDLSKCAEVPAGPCASLGKKVCDKGKCGITFTPGDAPSQQYGSCKKKVCDASGFATDMTDDANVYDDGNPCTVESCTGGVPDRKTLPTGTTCLVGATMGYCVLDPDPYNGNHVVCSECDPNGTPTCLGGAVCVGGKCVQPHCKNTMKDSGESDIDCGGATSSCLKCTANKTCTNGPTDCWSGLCLTGKCTPSMCQDGVQNGDETAADCGGQLCGQPCADGLPCILPTDCTSKVCKGNVCQVPSCTDGVQNGDEEGLDCGGFMSACPPCGS